MSLITELKRRKVLKLGAAYLVVAWLAVQAASIAFPAFEAPAWALRVFIFVAVIGFPVALLGAWLIELTPEGIRLDRAPTGNRRMFAIVAVLVVLGVAWFLRGHLAPRAVDDGPRSLAVLPFASLGQEAEATGIAGGLHDTLITQLSKLKGLEVRSRTSVMKYKNSDGGLKKIAQELGVSVILEGSVQHQGNRTVVNAQLIDALTDAHLWAETFDRSGDDLFALQADIAQRVAAALEVALSPAERKALTEAPTENREAYALFLQAQKVLRDSDAPMTDEAQEQLRMHSVELLERAVAADPKFALGWASLSRTYATVAWNTMFSDYRAYADKARRAAERAVAFGADLPEAHLAMGTVALQLDFDFPLAVRELELAVRGAPNSAEFHSRLAVAYRYNGRFEDSERACRRAHELDPTEVSYAFYLLSALTYLHRTDDALALMRQVATLVPDNYGAASSPAWIETAERGDLAPLRTFVRDNGDRFPGNPQLAEHRWILAMAEGDFDGALAALEKVPPEARSDLFYLMGTESYRRAGRDAEMRAVMSKWRDRKAAMLGSDRDPFVEALLRTALAIAAARVGDKDGAHESMAKADQLWGYRREPSDGGRVWYNLAAVHTALGEYDEACAKLEVLFREPSLYPAGRAWVSIGLGELHAQPCFRALMQKHGIDVSKEPFAFNRVAVAKAGG